MKHHPWNHHRSLLVTGPDQEFNEKHKLKPLEEIITARLCNANDPNSYDYV